VFTLWKFLYLYTEDVCTFLKTYNKNNNLLKKTQVETQAVSALG
jgi:hypothetical protein